MRDPMVVTVRRPNGLQVTLRVPGEHFQELLRRVNNEFGAPSRWIGGPEMPDMEKYKPKRGR